MRQYADKERLKYRDAKPLNVCMGETVGTSIDDPGQSIAVAKNPTATQV
jgi:hypothetical protein